MAGQTSIRKLPFAQAGEPLQQFPAVSQSLAEALDSTLFPPAAGKTPNDSFASYPLGISVLGLTSAVVTAGGWPAGSWQLVTIRRANNDQAAQFLCESTSTGRAEVRYRSGTVAGWSPWFQVVSKDTARGMHAGEYTFTASAALQSRTITFPAGTFQTKPFVVVSGANRDAIFTASAPTKDGFTANVGPLDGAGSVTRRVTWIAVELNGATE